MEQNRYRLHPFFLHFSEPSIEEQYREYILERVLKFTKATWCIVIAIAIIFSVVDYFCWKGCSSRIGNC